MSEESYGIRMRICMQDQVTTDLSRVEWDYTSPLKAVYLGRKSLDLRWESSSNSSTVCVLLEGLDSFVSQCLHLIAAEYKRCHCFWAHSMDRARKYTGTHTCVYMYVYLCLFIFFRNHEFTLTSVTIQCQMVDSSLPPFHILSSLF